MFHDFLLFVVTTLLLFLGIFLYILLKSPFGSEGKKGFTYFKPKHKM